LGKLAEENATWTEAFQDDPLTTIAIYHVDEPEEPYEIPENKGHEVMVYLSYIIDFYDDLDDITIFLHAHKTAWHNNDILEQNAIEHIKYLKGSTVTKRGYVNLRCEWEPGCPPTIHPATGEDELAEFPEAHTFTHTFKQLFPNHPLPKDIGATCCAQFAASRERIQAIPKAQYEYFRMWLIRTRYRKTGRLWEYIWHYVFTGEEVICPTEVDCYCDLYGICTESKQELTALREAYWQFVKTKEDIEKLEDGTELSPDPEREAKYLKSILPDLEQDYVSRKDAALARGWEKDDEDIAMTKL
jgi:hypothetical protein